MTLTLLVFELIHCNYSMGTGTRLRILCTDSVSATGYIWPWVPQPCWPCLACSLPWINFVWSFFITGVSLNGDYSQKRHVIALYKCSFTCTCARTWLRAYRWMRMVRLQECVQCDVCVCWCGCVSVCTCVCVCVCVCVRNAHIDWWLALVSCC